MILPLPKGGGFFCLRERRKRRAACDAVRTVQEEGGGTRAAKPRAQRAEAKLREIFRQENFGFAPFSEAVTGVGTIFPDGAPQVNWYAVHYLTFALPT